MWTSCYLRQIGSIAPRGVEYDYQMNRSKSRGKNIVKHLMNEVLYKSNTITTNITIKVVDVIGPLIWTISVDRRKEILQAYKPNGCEVWCGFGHKFALQEHILSSLLKNDKQTYEQLHLKVLVCKQILHTMCL